MDLPQNKLSAPVTLSRRRFLEASAISAVTARLGQVVVPSVPIDTILPDAGDVALRVAGDEKEGYGVLLMYCGHPVARHNSGGEFSAFFQNSDRSLEDQIAIGKRGPRRATAGK
jgi:hypothetical protein